jgi:hypothetical protein
LTQALLSRSFAALPVLLPEQQNEVNEQKPSPMRTLLRTLTSITLFAALALPAMAQPDSKTKDGSVFRLSMIHTGANDLQEYLNRLTMYEIPRLEATKAQGLILSYRIFKGDFTNDDDFNVVILVEFPSLSVLDPDPVREAKHKAIRDDLTAKLGGQAKYDELRKGFEEIRDFQGSKLMREVLLK